MFSPRASPPPPADPGAPGPAPSPQPPPPSSFRRRREPLEPRPFAFGAVMPQRARREVLDEKLQPPEVVYLGMGHHHVLDPSDLAAPQKPRQRSLAPLEAIGREPAPIDDHDLRAGHID